MEKFLMSPIFKMFCITLRFCPPHPAPEYTNIYCSVTKSRPTLCNPMDYCMPGFPIEQEKM